MRRFLDVVQVILFVGGLGLGGYVGYRAFNLMGKDNTGQLQSYLILAILALLLMIAAGVLRAPAGAESSVPAQQLRAPSQPPFPPAGGFRGGPHTGPQPPIGAGGMPGGPQTGPQPPLPGGPHTGPQPRVGAEYPGRSDYPGRQGTQEQQYPSGRTDQYPQP
jgi:hypothetical protein